MFKNMALGAKIGLGFGLLVMIVAILGVVAWNGITQIATNVTLSEEGYACIEHMNQCAVLRREFVIQGFTKDEATGKSADEKWADEYDLLTQQLMTLKDNKALPTHYKETVTSAMDSSQKYKAVFEKGADCRKSKDAAFASWGKIGWAVTEEIQTAKTKVIDPGMAAAKASADITNVQKWAGISEEMNAKIIEPFLLLRVNAMSLVLTSTEEQWKKFLAQLQVCKTGASEFTILVKGSTELENMAGKVADLVNQYETAGNQFNNSVVEE